MRPHLLIAACLLILPSIAHAGGWPRTLTVDYSMGDGDSRSRAREAAIEEIRKKAALQAGTIVSSTSTIKGDKLTEEIQLIGVSLVKVSEIAEQASLDAHGQVSLRVSAMVDLDESELQRRAAALREDAVKAKQIESLQAENSRLLESLDSIRKALAGRSSTVDTARLMDRHSKTLSALRDNEVRVGSVFSEGTLIALADVADQALTVATREVEDHVITPIFRTPVQARVLSVSREKGVYIAKVMIDWSINMEQAKSILARYLRLTTDYRKPATFLGERLVDRRAGESAASPLQQEVNGYLLRREVFLSIKLAGQTKRIPVLYRSEAEEFPNGNYCSEGRRATEKFTCLVNPDNGRSTLRGLEYGADANPITFRLGERQAKQATQIQAEWIYVVDGKETRFPAEVRDSI